MCPIRDPPAGHIHLVLHMWNSYEDMELYTCRYKLEYVYIYINWVQVYSDIYSQCGVRDMHCWPEARFSNMD